MKQTEKKFEIENGIQQRSYQFALRIIKLVENLPTSHIGIILGNQILRAGTSIGANVEEAIAAYRKDDFAYRMNISLKEARDTLLVKITFRIKNLSRCKITFYH